MQASSSFPAYEGGDLIEGFARVVALDGANAWLEPEQKTSCGNCHASAACGTTAASPGWLKARRFRIANDADLAVGERVVVGISAASLLKGSLTAYLLPLITMLAAGVAADRHYGDDLSAAMGALLGLAGGLLLAGRLAGRLSVSGDLAPRFLRRVPGMAPGTECQTGQGA
ncbi:SoxR reducing system RseC family protein [Magnetospirillum sp. UT-4]|uniref:SoxR reducing system RseC family protein n=1 Tax=Magnetospirillum sp. UT-4 TaxID=2681467 RepID=UPI00137E60A2|nr:SoxR reducing system RseC family protein [Magnetospirillum sp. UT-4]CAA7626413.1 Positive regulator of sigma E activity [Magnetospirillum sp. UT-4]